MWKPWLANAISAKPTRPVSHAVRYSRCKSRTNVGIVCPRTSSPSYRSLKIITTLSTCSWISFRKWCTWFPARQNKVRKISLSCSCTTCIDTRHAEKDLTGTGVHRQFLCRVHADYGCEQGLLHSVSPTDGWVNRACKPYSRGYVAQL